MALAEDFERHGAEVIERVRVEKPEAYIKVIASLLPKDLNLSVTRYDHLTDEQLIVRLKILTEHAAPILGRLIHDDAEASQMLPNVKCWIEAVKRPDGRNWHTDCGLLLRTHLGGPDGEVLCDRVHNAVCETCRVLMSRGILGTFETWKAGIPYPCMTGDIANTAELTVHEPDDGVVHFARWRLFHQNAVSRSAVPSPAREEDRVGRGEPLDTNGSLCSDLPVLPEAAE